MNAQTNRGGLGLSREGGRIKKRDDRSDKKNPLELLFVLFQKKNSFGSGGAKLSKIKK